MTIFELVALLNSNSPSFPISTIGSVEDKSILLFANLIPALQLVPAAVPVKVTVVSLPFLLLAVITKATAFKAQHGNFGAGPLVTMFLIDPLTKDTKGGFGGIGVVVPLPVKTFT